VQEVQHRIAGAGRVVPHGQDDADPAVESADALRQRDDEVEAARRIAGGARLVLTLLLCLAAYAVVTDADAGRTGTSPGRRATAEMVWIPAAEFTMGSDAGGAHPDERPAHAVWVDGVWMDATKVTNARFREFVEATGHMTTAEAIMNARASGAGR
jgi:formylglycine-generating enzyme required for sulfatase activity